MVYQPEAWLTSSMLLHDRSKCWPSKKFYWRETSALRAAVAQHGAASFCGQRYRSVAAWTVQNCMLTVTGHVTFFPCGDVLSLKQPEHMVASLNLVILHSWMQGHTAVRSGEYEPVLSAYSVFSQPRFNQWCCQWQPVNSLWASTPMNCLKAGKVLHGVTTAQGHWLLLGKLCG